MGIDEPRQTNIMIVVIEVACILSVLIGTGTLVHYLDVGEEVIVFLGIVLIFLFLFVCFYFADDTPSFDTEHYYVHSQLIIRITEIKFCNKKYAWICFFVTFILAGIFVLHLYD